MHYNIRIGNRKYKNNLNQITAMVRQKDKVVIFTLLSLSDDILNS